MRIFRKQVWFFLAWPFYKFFVIALFGYSTFFTLTMYWPNRYYFSDADVSFWLVAIVVLPFYLVFIDVVAFELLCMNSKTKFLLRCLLALCFLIPIFLAQNSLIQFFGQSTTLNVSEDIFKKKQTRFYAFPNARFRDVGTDAGWYFNKTKAGIKTHLVLSATCAAPIVDGEKGWVDSVSSLFAFSRFERRIKIEKGKATDDSESEKALDSFTEASKTAFLVNLKSVSFFERKHNSDLPNGVFEAEGATKYIKYKEPIRLELKTGTFEKRNIGLRKTFLTTLASLFVSFLIFMFSRFKQMVDEDLVEEIAKNNPLLKTKLFFIEIKNKLLV